MQIDSSAYNHNIENLMQRFDQKGIQTRPVWKLNHLQKPYKKFQNYKIINSSKLVENSLCLPSSFNLSDDDLNKVFKVLNG